MRTSSSSRAVLPAPTSNHKFSKPKQLDHEQDNDNDDNDLPPPRALRQSPRTSLAGAAARAAKSEEPVLLHSVCMPNGAALLHDVKLMKKANGSGFMKSDSKLVVHLKEYDEANTNVAVLLKVYRRPHGLTDTQWSRYVDKHKDQEWFHPHAMVLPGVQVARSGQGTVVFDINLNTGRGAHAIFRGSKHPQLTRSAEYRLMVVVVKDGVEVDFHPLRLTVSGRKRASRTHPKRSSKGKGSASSSPAASTRSSARTAPVTRAARAAGRAKRKRAESGVDSTADSSSSPRASKIARPAPNESDGDGDSSMAVDADVAGALMQLRDPATAARAIVNASGGPLHQCMDKTIKFMESLRGDEAAQRAARAQAAHHLPRLVRAYLYSKAQWLPSLLHPEEAQRRGIFDSYITPKLVGDYLGSLWELIGVLAWQE